MNYKILYFMGLEGARMAPLPHIPTPKNKYECTIDSERVCAIVTAGCYNTCVDYTLTVAKC